MGEDGRQDIRGLLNLPPTENGGIVLWALLIPPISSFGQWNEPENYGVTVTYEF